MVPALQAKLLRFLEEKAFKRVGGAQDLKVDVRVIAATNADLEAAVGKGRFREDLYFRLNVLRISVPPLRARGDDVLLLARRFLAEAGAKTGNPLRLSEAAEAAIRQASWPGNVRQLQNEMQRLAALVDRPEVQPGDLSAEALRAR
jgi:two-component system NtrC family response regulator